MPQDAEMAKADTIVVIMFEVAPPELGDAQPATEPDRNQARPQKLVKNERPDASRAETVSDEKATTCHPMFLPVILVSVLSLPKDTLSTR